MTDTKGNPTIRVSCLPFFIAMIVLIVLKISGTITTPWWIIFLAPIGLALVWSVLVAMAVLIAMLFGHQSSGTLHY